MIKTKEIIEKINSAKIMTPHMVYDVNGIGTLSELATVDRAEHRWYDIATLVFSTGTSFIGVRGPIKIHDECAGFDDIGIVCEAFEMRPKQTTTYVKIERGTEVQQ